MKCYVNVRLADVDRTLEWREVEAEMLSDAIKVAERMPDVEVALEASIYPNGQGPSLVRNENPRQIMQE